MAVNHEVYKGSAPTTPKGVRLDKHLGAALAGSGVSRGKVQEWIKKGLCTVDGKAVAKPNFTLAGGEEVRLLGEESSSSIEPVRGELALVHEARRFLVVNKPPGLTVHPAPGVSGETLIQRLLARFPGIGRMEGMRPGIVHRLDKDTSGLMVVALDEAARMELASQFSGRTVDKAYLALVAGAPDPAQALIDAPIGRDPESKVRMAVVPGGRPARSGYKVRWVSPDAAFSLVSVAIFTGRTHQIRVHLAHLGHPIVGDRIYGPARHAELSREHPLLARLAGRQMLHSASLSFTPPGEEGKKSFIAAPSKDFTRLPLHMARRTQRVGLVGAPGGGKSTLLALLKEAGVPVFSADACVAREYRAGADGWELLRRRYGERFVADETSPVDKAALFHAMTQSESLRREVMAMIHPLVRHRMGLFFHEHAASRLAVAEIPLLLEAGWTRGDAIDLVAAIHAPQGKRRRWLAERGLGEEQVALFESWQWPEEKKLEAADLVIENPGTLDGLAANARDFLSRLRDLRRARMRSVARELDSIWGDPAPGELDNSVRLS